jgi:hypothetical protein
MPALLPIDTCSDCPRCRIERIYTADAFENVHQWDCHGVTPPRAIAQVDTDDQIPPIPPFCPLRT